VIKLISGVLPGEHPLLEQAFRLCQSIFVVERGWEVRGALQIFLSAAEDPKSCRVLSTPRGRPSFSCRMP
jgi:hypothetical protein